MKRLFLLCIKPLAVAGILSLGSILHAQVANNTSVVGSVLDQSGAPVVGAKVTAVNEATQVTYPGMTNADGYYSITFVARAPTTLLSSNQALVSLQRRGASW
jgi:hypothetical protein